MKKSLLFRLMRFWPPYFGAGVRVTHVSPDLLNISVEMRAYFWNKNYVGTHFGGSLYSMVDPFYMLMLLENLGKNYIVWDKAASIRFKKPGRGTVTAQFSLTKEKILEIQSQADTGEKCEPHFLIQILDQQGEVVSEIEKILYVKRKRKS